MNRIRSIRDRLGVTQADLALALGKSQGNVAFYERGQVMPPDVAKRLITFAASKGLYIAFEDVYGPANEVETKGVAQDGGVLRGDADGAPPQSAQLGAQGEHRVEAGA